MKNSLSYAIAGLVAAITLGFGATAMAAAPKYKMEVVRGDGAMSPPSLIYAINDDGLMVGYVANLPGPFQTTLVRYTGPRSAGEVLVDSTNLDATGINASGDVVAGANGYEPAVWHGDGTRVALPLVSVTAINNNGWITGTMPWQGASVWHDGAATPLEGFEGGSHTVHGINDAGTSVGAVSYKVGEKFYVDAAIWDATGKLQRVTTPGANQLYAWSVNNSGHVVGDALSNSSSFAFFYDGVSVSRLPKVNGEIVDNAVDVNDRDEVLGDHGPVAGPVLWRKGVGYFLRDLLEDHGKDWMYLKAYDINNAGTIVGWGKYKGKDRGFIAKRVK